MRHSDRDRAGIAAGFDADPRELTNLAERPEHAKVVEELSQQLRAAAKTTFPPSGQTPELKPELWAPNLTDP